MDERGGEALAAVNRVIAGLPEGHGLAARYEADWDMTVDPGISILREADGRQHVVHVQVGDATVTVNTSGYKTTDLGDGLVMHQYEDVTYGKMHRNADAAFEKELSDILRAHLDAFEPLAGVGAGTHPLTDEMVAGARVVVDAYNASREPEDAIKMGLNVFGQAKKENDVLTFMRRDGTALPVAIHTGVGQVLICDIDNNELIERLFVDRQTRLAALPGALQVAFDGMAAEYGFKP